ncbi:MAG TPA: DUF5985 family protein [Stellaceae bacterium]|jgi:hypothetical protein|nr:DUF5985 family protein [Stellaceae bacterium]
MVFFGAIVYVLCFFSSSLCAYLLTVAYLRRKEKLLLWSGACFCLLAFNNLLVFVDIVLLPDIDLTPLRSVASLVAIAVLLYGFIWEIE